jgi:hypothetical protein
MNILFITKYLKKILKIELKIVCNNIFSIDSKNLLIKILIFILLQPVIIMWRQQPRMVEFLHIKIDYKYILISMVINYSINKISHYYARF